MESTKLEKNKQNMKIATKDGVIVELEAPYCSAEEWSERTHIPLKVIKEALYNGKISRYQLTPKGRLFVNVVAETQRVLNTPAWK